MKFFTNKKIIQKMTIVLVILMLFNFIIPNYSRAAVINELGEKIVSGLEYLLLKIGDGIINVMQEMFIGTPAILTADDQRELNGYKTLFQLYVEKVTNGNIFDRVKKLLKGDFIGFYLTSADVEAYLEYKSQEDYEDIYEIALSPKTIFSGNLPALNINFISSPNTDDSNSEQIEWLNDYKAVLTKLEDDMNNLKENSVSDEDYQEQVFPYMYVYIIAGGTQDSDLVIIEKVKTWYRYMHNTYNENAFLALIMEDNYQDKEKKQAVHNIVISSGLASAVEKAGKDDSINQASGYFVSKEKSPANVLHDIIATWYKIMRNIALIIMLSMLVYIGIRIVLTSVAADNAKYKKMLIDWVVAICLLLVLHYIMAFTVNITQVITDAFNGNNDQGITYTEPDEIMNTVRINAENATSFNKFGYCILYLVLIFYTIYFVFFYVKRVVYAAFLTFIAPLVAITYPLDKMGDSKSQAFDMWVREYILNAVIQPVHLIIYTVMVTTALDLAVNNPIYAIVVIGAMIPAEKFIKEMFGLDTKKGPHGGLLAGAAMMTGMNRLAGRRPPQFGHHPGENGKGGGESQQEKTKKPKLAEDKIEALSKGWSGNNNDENTINEQHGTNTGDIIDIDHGEDNPDDDNNENVENENPYQMPEIKPEDMPTEEDINNSLNPIPEDYTDEENEELGEDEGTIPQQFSQENEDFSNATEAENQNHNRNNFEQLRNNVDDTNLNNMNANNVNQNNGQSNNTKEENKRRRKIARARRRAARSAVNRYYRARDIQMLKSIGRGAARIGAGVITAGVAGTLGLAAGVASGDPSKALQYTAVGGLAGAKIGRNIGDTAANLTGGAVDFVKREKEARGIYKNELAKYDDNYKQQLDRENSRKFARSADTKTAIRARMGYGLGDKEKMEKAMNFVETASNYGMRNLDTILNAYGLTEGVDAEGHNIGESLDENKALLVGMMAEKGNDRKTVKSDMRSQLTDNIYDEGRSGKTEDQAYDEAKEPTNDFMKWYDLGTGMNYKDAGKQDKFEDYQKAKEKAERRKQVIEAETIKAQIREETEAKAKSKRGNNRRNNSNNGNQ